MNGILGAVLTFLVGAVAVFFSVMVVLAVVRSILGGSPGGRPPEGWVRPEGKAREGEAGR